MEQNPEETEVLREAEVVRVLLWDETLALQDPACNLGQVKPFYQQFCISFTFAKGSIHR